MHLHASPQGASPPTEECGRSAHAGWTALLRGHLGPHSSRTGGSSPDLILCVPPSEMFHINFLNPVNEMRTLSRKEEPSHFYPTFAYFPLIFLSENIASNKEGKLPIPQRKVEYEDLHRPACRKEQSAHRCLYRPHAHSQAMELW